MVVQTNMNALVNEDGDGGDERLQSIVNLLREASEIQSSACPRNLKMILRPETNRTGRKPQLTTCARLDYNSMTCQMRNTFFKMLHMLQNMKMLAQMCFSCTRAEKDGIVELGASSITTRFGSESGADDLNTSFVLVLRHGWYRFS
ncbi:unnamed protein product [Nippostrongylus brasiliensis]|uniref:Uncharacterized protein n=1 Tax=Nippostrongylus brasiliensis TaxID=27835 RepID=A0A0N4YGH6_NIPBR|nr:unnamed protein product [Nippostrongylus brasiliensis]